MATLIYMTITSLDGYVEDADGKFEWAAPDEEVHAFANDLERPIATYLVDECQLFLNPVVVGAGKRALPDHVHADLELVNERRFKSSVVYLHYRISV
jgi:dihydrofolate reductase